MSFIVKGIDLPKGEELLTVSICNGFISVYTVTPKDTVIEHKAQAIQIPKDHGDIKDVSNIIKKFDENIEYAEAKPMGIFANAFLDDALVWSAEYDMIKDDIDNAPTILDKEEE
jgi:hypothetical protein